MLRAAFDHHRAGRAAAAAALYERVLQQRPSHADALHLYGVLHAQTGQLETALPLLTKAVRRAPRNAGFLNDLGNALNGLGRLDEAVAHYRRAASLDSSNANVRFNLGHALRAAGRPARPSSGSARRWRSSPITGRRTRSLAARCWTSARPRRRWRRSGRRSRWMSLPQAPTPTSATRSAKLARWRRRKPVCAARWRSTRSTRWRTPISATCCRTSTARTRRRPPIARPSPFDPAHAVAHANLGNALKRLGREDEAVASLEHALELKPENATYQANLGMVHVARGDAAAALACFGRAAALRHGPPLAPDVLTQRGEERPAVPVAPFKLQHDAEQIRRLCGAGRIDESFGKLADAYEKILAALPADAPPEEPVALEGPDWRRIAAAYNRPLHLPEAPAAAGAAVNPGLDAAAIEGAYRESAPNLVVVDDFLTPDALERLWRFCLDATVWYQVKRGYLGAYLVDGFGTALALQIADELRARLPGIFGPHRLEQLWAYKYDSRLQGIATHADFAAVNVNFWVTPDEANRDPASGGLVIHKAHAPSDWAFRTYNADSARMAEFLAEAGDEPVTVPYRQNRVVIFDSDLFHRTDDLDFRPGYENRRINVTMLFGDRAER